MESCGDRKFQAPKAKRILQEAPGAASSAVPVPSQSCDPNGDPAKLESQARLDPLRSNPVEFAGSNSSNKVDPEGIPVGEHGAGSPQEGRDKEVGSNRALGSPKQSISNGMEENLLELPQPGILEANGTGEDELESSKPGILDGAGENCPESPKPGILKVDGAGENCPESPKPGILDGAGENCPESPKLAILEVDGAGEEPPESGKHKILDGMGQNHLESSQLGILEGNGAGEEQLESPQMRIPEADEAGKEQLESLKLVILDGTGEDQLESPKPGIPEVDGAAEEQLETPTHVISDGAAEEQPEPVKPGISDGDGAAEEQPEPLKEGIWDGAGEKQLEAPKAGDSGAAGSSPEDTETDTAPAESSEVLDAEGQGEGALQEGCGAGIALSTDTGSPDHPRDPQSHGGDAEIGNSQIGNPRMATAGRDPAATSTEPQEQREGTSPELPAEKPFPFPAGQIHTGSTGTSPVQPRERAPEPADASDVIRGLIRELSDLNRLAMGAHRGLELLRRPKPRRGRRPVPGGSRWKEG
ncbi:break repair meiotic recombinase recruitment factor 1 [Poecile atricapillus]|uniref:break repair meiotic recombinase recruitment factor 1 n=1 Tax=Poecile atricapillus TaxID=48891 RepID=UPI00273A3938|nr:break repair meiotic recombinase recruitment factor 1 [Poecile atricapillus]